MAQFITILFCAMAVAPTAFGRASLGAGVDIPELTQDGRHLTVAGYEMPCSKVGHAHPYQPCGGKGHGMKCCPMHKGVMQVCVQTTSTKFQCLNRIKPGREHIAQSWNGKGTAPAWITKAMGSGSSSSSKPAPTPARKNTPPPKSSVTAARSNIAFDVGLESPPPPRGGGGGGHKKVGGAKNALSTYFNGIGAPFGGCGTMASQLFDDNGKPKPFVALNFQDTSIGAPFVQPASGGNVGAFDNGSNCGRWVEISVGQNCKGGKNTDSGVCLGGGYQADQHTGKTIYGFVADSCGDNNYWCRTDKDHLDISAPYLDSLGLKDGWNGRQITWSYIDDTPPGWSTNDGLKFMWKSNSKWIRNGKGFYADIIISNTSNGIGSVEQKIGNGWANLDTNAWLGLQYSLQQPSEYRDYTCSQTREITVRVKDKSGNMYGTYRIVMNCNDSDQCSDNTRAPAEKI